MVDAGLPAPSSRSQVNAIDVSPLDATLLDVVVRLVRLVDGPPAQARFVAPLVVTHEIIYRLLMGAQGDRLRHIAVVGGYSPRIVQAIARLRKDLNKPLRGESMA